MNTTLPTTMKAAVIDRFGGPEELHIDSLPVPKPKAREILIQLDVAGVGVWDPEIRKGEFKPTEPRFPYVIGNDGSGTVAAVGKKVSRFRVGDRVYAFTMKPGFYAEYVAVDEDCVAPVPPGLNAAEAGALGADGITALRGLDDQLRLRAGQRLLIYGASGGIGHIALQLAKRIGAEVLAVASGQDGIELVKRLGADRAAEGHDDDIVTAIRQFAPERLDAALVLASGRQVNEALKLVKQGGRVAHPNGVEPVPDVPEGVTLLAYNGDPDRKAFERLNALIGDQPFHVELKTYSLEDVARAHREVTEHHLGKLALRLHAA